MTATSELIPAHPRPANAFPVDGRRLLIYVVYDPRGDVEDYVLHALTGLRRHMTRILVVVNGALTARGRERLSAVSDEVVERENRGYDIWGYKHGLDHVGGGIADYDEVVIANDTWYGPVRSFSEVFERMDERPVHFWGLTDHARVEPHPFTHTGYLPYHLQSYWIAVRRDMLLSPEWAAYWHDLPELTTYSDAVVKHEGVFTEHFTQHGFLGDVSFPLLLDTPENYPVMYARQLLEAGCPTLKRRAFFQWPPYLDQAGVVSRWTLDAAAEYGYPIDLIYADMARNVAPRVMNAGAALMSVLPEDDVSYDPAAPLRTLVIAHIFYPEMTEEMLDRADYLPGEYDLLITTPDENGAAEIRRRVADRSRRGDVEVRLLESNNGRDQGAFLVGCRDVILDGGYELLVKIHSKKTPQDGPAVGAHFKEQQFGNLLNSAGYAANVVALFQNEPGLGLAYPPTVHLGHPTIGHGWWENKPPFADWCRDLGIRVPLDEGSPLAPFGSMYFARPDALRLLVEHAWTYEDFGGADAYQDGGLAHVLERMPSYAAGERGYHTRTIAGSEYLSMSYTALSYNLDQLSMTMPGTTMDKIQLLRRLGEWDYGTARDLGRMFVALHLPQLRDRAKGLYHRTQRARGLFWRLRHPSSWRRG
ncbi:rhamnan synthesis F family protein [Microbacterium panaciterrae]|uniref:Rhamnan synthesis F family protein n=1 Tax=Microbacterium panaciterrae TaxID=985759 RepID=A0ABP8PCU2_9MICO